MRDVTGQGCNKADAPIRPDLPLHDMTGGNSWLSAILASVDSTNAALFDPYNYAILSGAKYPGAKVDMAGLTGWGTKLKAGSERAIQQIQYGSTLSEHASTTASELVLKIQNNSAHKLISGYPEGRRLFLNVKWYDADGNELKDAEINPYLPLVTGKDAAGNDTYVSGGDLDHAAAGYRDDLIFEAKMKSELVNEPQGFTLHFALGTGRYKDNRIPPVGFDTTKMAERKIEPVENGVSKPEMFTEDEYRGGYKLAKIPKPEGAAGYVATLYYQTTSKEYVEFLYNELEGVAGKTTLASPTPSGQEQAYVAQTDPFFANLKDWGKAVMDLWLHNGGSAPVMMAKLSKVDEPPPPTVTINAPTDLTATAGKGKVTLSWQAPTGSTDPIAGYKIYTLSAGKYTYVGTSTGTTWIHSKLRAGQTYTYVVTAYAVVGGTTYESIYSNMAGPVTVR